MQNHYRTLGVNSSATPEEIRRAYRILARRYHPDVNPDKGSAEKFRAIALAYETLVDDLKRRQYDIELEHDERRKIREKFKSYAEGTERKQEARDKQASTGGEQKSDSAAKSQDARSGATRRPTSAAAARPAASATPTLSQLVKPVREFFSSFAGRSAPRVRTNERSVSKISIVEVSVDIKDAISGIKKTVEITDSTGSRKVSVRIPSGVRAGSVIRLKNTNDPGEELVIIVRVAAHPFLSIQARGLVMEVPISVNEAISGASITIPTLEEPVVVKVPPGTQSGTEIRLKGKGLPSREGAETDLVVRFMIRVPESADAVGIKDKSAAFDTYYEHSVRHDFPKSIMESLK